VPWVVSIGLGYDLAISLLIVQAVVNLHHFVVDGFLWRLRDPAVRSLLVGDERAPARREQVSNLRALAWSVPAVLLFFLGVLDVMQLAATRVDAPPEVRDRMMAVNDSDSRAWVRQAQGATAAGDLDGAKADLGHAVELSPWNADAQRSLARLHVVVGRDDEAWSRYQTMPKGLCDDADAALLFAGVAERLGKLEEAELLGRRALAILEGTGTLAEVDARRSLGSVLLKGGKAGEARALLVRGLDDAEAALGYDPLRKGQLLEVGLALADADVALSQTDPALVLFQRCLEGAKQADRADVAFHALSGRARVFLARDDHPRALESFQAALRFVDEVKGDPERVAHAWLDYAKLLALSEAPMRIRFACGLKARSAAEQMKAGAHKDELLSLITAATRYVEEVLTPDDAESVRKDVDAAAADALSLSYPDQP
jgi:tetratricopeptide (TPR) repeat protein